MEVMITCDEEGNIENETRTAVNLQAQSSKIADQQQPSPAGAVNASLPVEEIPSLRPRATILKEGQRYELPLFSDGVWQCPFCEEGKVLFIDEGEARNHIHNEHAKKQFKHNEWVVYLCSQSSCGVLRDRSHYHCPTCDKAVISRGDFAFHLKSHETKHGGKPTRGRRKTLAAVIGNQAGLQNIQLFSHASLIVSPTILSLIDNQQQFWSELEVKCGMTCLRDGDEGQQFCVLQGQYDSVIKANSFLERYVLDKLQSEVAAKLVSTAYESPSGNKDVNDVDENEGVAGTDSSSARPSSDSTVDVRRSGRKRRPNSTLDEYITPKSARIHDNDDTANSMAIRQSSVAHILKTSVEQECHVTLSKNIESGEYQVHMMFPPPIISEPQPDADNTVLDTATAPKPDSTALDIGEDPLDVADDDDEDEDYKVDGEAETAAASDDEMDDTADAADQVSTASTSRSRVKFRCPVCSISFDSIDNLLKHKKDSHSSTDTATSGSSALSSSTTSTPHYCKECQFSTPLKQTLKLHISREHREKQLECLDCHEKFGPLIDLKTHIRETGHRKGQHTNLYKQMVECKVCNKHMQLKNLKAHMELVHEKVKNFSCEICGKMFGTRFLVKEHMEIHKSVTERHRPWKCALCGAAFYKKLPLDEHMAKHVGQPQYSCDQCPKKFYHLSGWKRHIQHHGEARPFVCNICGKAFKTSTNLSAHKTVHTPMAFMCLCGKSYQQKHTLKSHQEKCPMHQDIIASQLAEEQYHTAQKYMCGFCQATFFDFSLVEEHVKQHVADSVENEGLESTLSLTEQQTDEQDLPPGVIDGSGLDHLAMTAALEQQNMISTTSGGRALIVTDIGGEQVQQLVVYQDGSLIPENSQLTTAQLTSGSIVSHTNTHQLIDQEGRLIDTNGQIIEQTGQQLRPETEQEGQQVQLITGSETRHEDMVDQAIPGVVTADSENPQ